MNKKIRYGSVIAVCLFLFSCEKKSSVSLPPMAETFRKDDDNPFGGSVAYKLVQQLYPDNGTRIKKEDIDKTWRGIYDTAGLLINISKNFYSSDADVDAIMEFVKAGNDMVLCSGVFDDNLMDRIGCSVNSIFEYRNILNDKMASTSIGFDSEAINDKNGYQYYYRPFSRYFSKLPKENIRVLGYNEDGNVNSFIYFFGKGKLFLHCDPRAFSNYFLLQKDNYHYLQHFFSLTKKDPQHLYWNDYYVNIRRPRSGGGSGNGGRSGSNNSSQSSLSVIMENPALSAAFWLILILLLLYVIYNMKRRQRIVEKVKPNENTTVSFTETVGRLYLQKKDNRNIAEKMITYFNEFVRNQYFLNSNHPNAEFITTLSRKSGIERDRVESLYRAIEHAQQSHDLDDYQLLSLNQQIQNFYKNKI
ncbi:MAG: DUF4350 domain-containing protein [Ferruginibacter sp.]